MPDLNLELALDALSTAVEAVVPRKLPNYRFTRNDSAIYLDEADDTLGIRYFEWGDGELRVGDDEGAPKTDRETVWYTLRLGLRIFYPKTFAIEGDTTKRGLAGLRLSDVIDLNKVLMFGDPLSALNFDYYALQLLGSNRAGKIRETVYRLTWSETLL